MTFQILRILSPLLYLIAAVYYYRFFSRQDDSYKLKARLFDAIALTAHTLVLLQLAFITGHVPLADAFQSISAFMWCFALLNKIYIRSEKEYSLGMFQTSILFILQGIAMIFIDVHAPLPEILQNVYFETHVVFNLLGYASFSSAFLAGVMYILLFYEFKGQKLGYFYDRLPSLSYLETLNFRALLVGFVFNTIGIIIGAYTGKAAWGTYWSWDPKLIAVLIAWLIYAIALLGKRTFNWKGNHLAYAAIIGFGWILFSMLIINSYFSRIHAFY
jgi:ABC-type transport system involved in cytochrome c biogenesis permease subunit